MPDITEFNIGQGETFRIAATIENLNEGSYLDISGYTFSGQVRENFTTDEVAATIEVTKVEPYVSGTVLIQLAPNQTQALSQRKYVYDVKMTSGSISRRILEGYFTVRPSVTR